MPGMLILGLLWPGGTHSCGSGAAPMVGSTDSPILQNLPSSFPCLDTNRSCWDIGDNNNGSGGAILV